MNLLVALFACNGHEPVAPPPAGGGATTPVTVDLQPPARAEGESRDPGSQTCDAGTEAWVQRVFPLVLGRKPHGAAEVKMWAAMADQHGRDVVVRALTDDPLYLVTWRPILADMLLVSRSGSDLDQTCHELPLLGNHDGSLAQHIRQYGADEAVYGAPFNMADVLLDSLVGDDLSAAWQANIFARTNYVPICANTTDPYQIESERRLALGDEFLDNYLNRSITCMTCHNSEYSVTDSLVPSEDRTWGVEGALFEKALFELSTGPADPDGFYAAFKFAGVIEDSSYYNPTGQYALRPWGWSDTCGTYDASPPAQDYLGIEGGYFLDPVAPESTLFDLAEAFGRGADALAAGPLVIGDGGALDPDHALAYLTAEHIADRVWELANGSALTIPYGFSRNKDQQVILEALTNRFLTSGWSLRELLVAIATDPLFNTGLPGTCGAPAYGLEPVLYPYATDDPNPALQNNGPGDLVHRHYARVLVASANHALGWDRPAEYFGFVGNTEDKDLATAIGVFLNRSEAGFSGTDLQGALAWESRYGTCFDPAFPNDVLQQAIDAGIAAGATVETVALTIKDRILADGQWSSDEERLLVESLLETPLSTAMIAAPEGTRRNLGLFCGALTVSPRFFLTVEPRPVGPVPLLDLGNDLDCERLRINLLAEGISVTCNAGFPE